MTTESILTAKIRMLLSLLVDGEYEVLAAVTGGDRLSAEEIATAIAEYGRVLVYPPDGLPPDLELDEIEGVEPRTMWAVMSLWTAEEGCSDLSMELSFVEVSPGLWLNTLENIRVM